MRLTIVGCAPAYTQRAGRASSCYLVEEGGRALVLDLGQGAFNALAQHRSPESVGGVLISHLHADHLVDLVPLRHYLRFERDGASVPLRAPAELRPRMDAFQGETDFLLPLAGEDLRPGEFELAGFTIEAQRVTHTSDSFGFRVAAAGGGPGLVYSGDCGVADDLLPLIRPGDTLLCEAAFGARSEGGGMHLSAMDAAGVAAGGEVERLVLTHILDRNSEVEAAEAARRAFDREVVVARPGLQLNIV